MLGKGATLRGDVNTALLKNHLYYRWAENATDKAQADEYRMQSQKALLDFMSAHKDQPGINAAFFKIIANKYRNPPPPPPGVADDEKYQDDYLSKLNPIFQLAIAKDEYNLALSDAGLITKLEESRSAQGQQAPGQGRQAPGPGRRQHRRRGRAAAGGGARSSRASSRKFAARASRNASRPPPP